MEDDFFQWSEFMVRLLEQIVLKALGPSLGVNRMWTKKNDRAPKSECAEFFKYMLKKGIFERNSSLTILLVSFGLHLSSLLVFQRCGLQIFLQQFLQKTLSDLICTCLM